MDHSFDFSRIDMVLEGYYPQMERDLLALLSIPSVKAAPAPYAPFGQPVADALDFTLACAASLGLATENLDGYCGLADLPGGSSEQIGVLAHLDVVPANGSDWDSPPFEPELRDGVIYGRGAIDDKGPLLAALYAAAALGDCGLPLSKSIRLIFGCDEESGMSCVRHYLSRYPQPSCGFTPDGAFPLIVGEKGILHYTLSARWPQEAAADRLGLTRLEAGSAANVVPDRASVSFACPADGPASLFSRRQDLSITTEEGRLTVVADGRAAHASTPEQGDNALVKLVRFLEPLDFGPAGAKDFLLLVAELTRDELYGNGFGLAGSDHLSQLTQAPTQLRLEAGGGCLTLDLRFPLTRRYADYAPQLTRLAAALGLEFTPLEHQDPLYLGADNDLARTLLSVYRQATDDQRPPLVIGGGTYAKTMDNFLAFGPETMDQPSLAHQANESVSQGQLLFLAKLYARALYQLAK